jgi:hypothetical protein
MSIDLIGVLHYLLEVSTHPLDDLPGWSGGSAVSSPRTWRLPVPTQCPDLGLDPIGHARIRALSSGAAASEASLQDLAAEGRAIREARLTKPKEPDA